MFNWFFCRRRDLLEIGILLVDADFFMFSLNFRFFNFFNNINFEFKISK